MRNRKNIDVLHKHDLKQLLKKWDILDDFDNKKIKCRFCDETINENNIGAVFPKNNNVNFCCSKLNCLNNLNK